ncbi:MAG: anti-phage deoxyguanosine triphosphatase [Janthinobacterium lividum]
MDSWDARREPRPVRPEDTRTEAQVDYARVIHSASFRRLQGKTQILNLGDSDFYRTRLTHSLEVAQIAGGIVQRLAARPGDAGMKKILACHDLVQAIGLNHDLGHPPFGHGGEVALNFCMRDHGGFEGNGQTLRILGHLEKYSASFGANLTRRTMLGVLKYPVPFSAAENRTRKPVAKEGAGLSRLIDRHRSKPPKAYMDSEADVVDWILANLPATERGRFCEVSASVHDHGQSIHKSFDCSIMDLADDIAFGVHDLEDAITLGLLDRDAFVHHVPCASFGSLAARLRAAGDGRSDTMIHEAVVDALFGNVESRRKEHVGLLVNHFITECQVAEKHEFSEPLLRYRVASTPSAKILLNGLKKAVRDEVIYSAGVQQLEFKGQAMVVAVFEALASDPDRLLPKIERAKYLNAASPQDGMRTICDHIAGMTDGYLLRMYERLFSPGSGSVFDRI